MNPCTVIKVDTNQSFNIVCVRVCVCVFEREREREITQLIVEAHTPRL